MDRLAEEKARKEKEEAERLAKEKAEEKEKLDTLLVSLSKKDKQTLEEEKNKIMDERRSLQDILSRLGFIKSKEIFLKLLEQLEGGILIRSIEDIVKELGDTKAVEYINFIKFLTSYKGPKILEEKIEPKNTTKRMLEIINDILSKLNEDTINKSVKFNNSAPSAPSEAWGVLVEKQNLERNISEKASTEGEALAAEEDVPASENWATITGPDGKTQATIAAEKANAEAEAAQEKVNAEAEAAAAEAAAEAAEAAAAAAAAEAAARAEILKKTEENIQAIEKISKEIDKLENTTDITVVEYNNIMSNKLEEKIELYQTNIDLLRSSKKYGEAKDIDKKIIDIEGYIDETREKIIENKKNIPIPENISDPFAISSSSGGSIDTLIENAFNDDLINMAFNQDNM